MFISLRSKVRVAKGLIGRAPAGIGAVLRWSEEHAPALFVLGLSVTWSAWIGLDPLSILDRWELATVDCRAHFEDVKNLRPVSISDWGGSEACVFQARASVAHYAGMFASLWLAVRVLRTPRRRL